MRVVGLSEEQINNVHQVLSSILQLGNIEFITTGGAQIQDKSGNDISIVPKFKNCHKL